MHPAHNKKAAEAALNSIVIIIIISFELTVWNSKFGYEVNARCYDCQAIGILSNQGSLCASEYLYLINFKHISICIC